MIIIFPVMRITKQQDCSTVRQIYPFMLSLHAFDAFMKSLQALSAKLGQIFFYEKFNLFYVHHCIAYFEYFLFAVIALKSKHLILWK